MRNIFSCILLYGQYIVNTFYHFLRKSYQKNNGPISKSPLSLTF
jgi:hypothetical protein